MMNNNPFGSGNQNNTGNNPFDTNNANNTGSNPFGTTNASNTTLFPNTTTNNANSTSLFNNSATANKSGTFLDNNPNNSGTTGGMIGSIQDNSLNLYNLTLKEIVEKQTAILDQNVNEFKKSVQTVFEQDMKLMAAKTNYLNTQNKIKTTTIKMNELSEALDYFATELDKYDTKEENNNENARIIADFELLCDKFYEKVENFRDENDGVLDLINENYDLIEKLDALLDNLEVKTSLL